MARSFITDKRACHLPDEADSVCYGNSREDEAEKEVEQECYGLPMKLINILEKPANWRKRSLITQHDLSGQRLYAEVHQDPIMYRNMYQYLVFRYASPDRLNRATDQLLNWEKDFHNHDFNEVVKCWRLHLGSSEVLKTVMDSVNQESGFWDMLYNRYLPVKLTIRKWRTESAPLPIRTCFSAIYKFYNLIFYAVVPFMGASALYFDIFKDISFAYLIYTSLYDMSGGDLLNPDYDFEAALLITLILAIISVQVYYFCPMQCPYI